MKNLLFFFIQSPNSSPVTNVLDCNLQVSEFYLHWCYEVHLWTKTPEKGMKLLIPPAK